MLNLIQADLFKMRKSTIVKILFAITTLCAIVMVVIAYMIPQGKLDESYTGIGFLFSDVDVISILGGVLAAFFICGDFDNKTIHDAISSGCSRRAVIISKATVFFCALVIILLPYAIITGIALSTGSRFDMGNVSIGFLNMLSKDFGIVFDVSAFIKMISVMLTLIIVYVAQLSICVPLALMVKKPVLVVAIFYGFSVLSGQLARLSESSELYDNILSCTPYGGNYNFVTLETGAGSLFKAIVVSFIFIIIMIAFAYSIFRKSEIK